jgi:DHA3 family macrolide efflux protein-like MFS transporter
MPTDVHSVEGAGLAQTGSRWKLPFFSIWAGQAFSLIGSDLVQFALVWWLTKTTESASVLALASMMALLPRVFISPFAGALVDRWNRRAVMLVADGVIALATVAVAALFALDLVEVWHIYLLMFVRAAGGTFHWPAMSASTALMVPEEHLARIAGINQALFGVVGVIAPPVGALLLDLLPLQATLAIDVGTAALAIAPLLFVRLPQPVRSEEAAGTSVLADMREGFRYVWRWPGLMGMIALALVVKVALTPAFSLVPLLVRQHLGGDASQLGLLEAVGGVGMVAGGLVLGIWGGFRRKIYTAMVGVVLLGVGFLALGSCPATLFWLALTSFLVIGFVIPMIDGSTMAIIQGTVSPAMHGRVMTTMISLLSVTSPISLAVAGPVAGWLGLRSWYFLAAALCIAAGAAGFVIPAIVNIEENAGGERTTAVPHPAFAEAEA